MSGNGAVEVVWAPVSAPVPVPEGGCRPSRFKASPSTVTDDLVRELRLLDASRAVLEAGFRPRQLRVSDTWPKTGERPSTPGVRATIDTRRRGVLVFECGAFSTFYANLRGLTLHLAALRAVDRYGVSTDGQQYKGWAALPAGPGQSESFEDSVAWLCRAGGWATTPGEIAGVVAYVADGVEEQTRGMLRAAAKACHPDTGGSVERFEEFERHARRVRVMAAAG